MEIRSTHASITADTHTSPPQQLVFTQTAFLHITVSLASNMHFVELQNRLIPFASQMV